MSTRTIPLAGAFGPVVASIVEALRREVYPA